MSALTRKKRRQPEKMKFIKITSDRSLSVWRYGHTEPGEIREVPESHAKSLVNEGRAEYVEGPAKEEKAEEPKDSKPAAKKSTGRKRGSSKKAASKKASSKE